MRTAQIVYTVVTRQNALAVDSGMCSALVSGDRVTGTKEEAEQPQLTA